MTTTEPKITGTKTVTKEKTETKKTGTEMVTKTKSEKVGDPWYEEVVVNEYWDEVIPQHENPYYRGPDYLARYYNLSAPSPVPVFNKNGYFEPDTASWISKERPGEWDTNDLTIANPSDPSDTLLYDGAGNPKAVLSSLTASASWMSNEMLAEMMRRGLGMRETSGALEIDGTLYTNNSIFGIIPARNETGVNGELIVNGGIVGADIGLLAPKKLRIHYDHRGGELLDLQADTQIYIRRQARLPQVTQ